MLPLLAVLTIQNTLRMDVHRINADAARVVAATKEFLAQQQQPGRLTVLERALQPAFEASAASGSLSARGATTASARRVSAPGQVRAWTGPPRTSSSRRTSSGGAPAARLSSASASGIDTALVEETAEQVRRTPWLSGLEQLVNNYSDPKLDSAERLRTVLCVVVLPGSSITRTCYHPGRCLR